MGLGKSSVVGQVIMWSGNLAIISGVQEPVSGWVLCNGVALSKTDPKYASLFNVIAGTYGSDVNNFNVPNLQGRFPIGKSGSYALAATGGAETVTLALSQVASHTHGTASFATGDSGSSGHTHGAISTAGNNTSHTHQDILPSKSIQQGTDGSTVTAYLATGGSLVNNAVLYGEVIEESVGHTHTVTPNTAGAHTHTVTTGSAGSSGAHNNMPPYAAVHFLIRY